jgi:hypothetical protein
MRTVLALLALCAGIAAQAQTSATANTTLDQSTRRLMLPPVDLNLVYIRPQKPNEIRLDRVTYSGILVHFAKPENQLQLINPMAPPPYSSMDNAVLDPNTHNVTGWKLFSISF